MQTGFRRIKGPSFQTMLQPKENAVEMMYFYIVASVSP
jgi:hypothetical protein